MSVIRPLRAIRYSTSRGRDLTTRLSPPYDVLDDAARQALLERDARNFALIDLPHVPAKDAGPPAVYEQAADTFQNWLRDGTLIRDERDGLYVYHQTYRHAGVDYTRRMFFARLRLEPFGASGGVGSGSVFPHEQTFGGPKEDRLCLSTATVAQLSPIFGLYDDAGNAVAKLLELGMSPEPLATGVVDDVENELWSVTDRALITEVTSLLQSQPTYIADGHHRYGTALLYRDRLAQQKGTLAADHPANFVLCVFCALDDRGLLILPTHRALPNVRATPAAFANDSNLVFTPLETANAEAAAAALPRHGPQAIGVYLAAEERYYALRPTDERLLDAVAPQRSPAWRRLALAFLHAYVLDRLISPKLCAGQTPEIHYNKSAAEAVADVADAGGVTAADGVATAGGVAFLLQPTTMSELRAVCQAGDLMPQKSTFFYPKLASGLVINSLRET